MAEALFNTMGDGIFIAYSAGYSPASVVNRFAVEEIRGTGYPVKQLKSKGWEAFLQPKAPIMNFVITVCDDVAKQALPIWPGNPMKAHWGLDDPAAVEGSFEDKKEAFKKAFQQLRHRIDLLTQLPLAHLHQASLDQSMAKWPPMSYIAQPTTHC